MTALPEQFEHQLLEGSAPVLRRQNRMSLRDRLLMVLLAVWTMCAVWPAMFDSTFSKGLFPVSPLVALVIMALIRRPTVSGYKLGFLYIVLTVCSMFAIITRSPSSIYLVSISVKLFWAFAVMFICTLLTYRRFFSFAISLVIILMIAQAIYYSYFILTYNLPLEKIDKFSNGVVNRNGLALTICVCVPFLMHSIINSRNLFFRIVSGAFLLGIAYYLFLLGSRGGWIAFGVTTMLFFLFGQNIRRNIKQYVFGIMMLGGMAFFADRLYETRTHVFVENLGLDKRIASFDRLDRDKSFVIRTELRKKALSVWYEYPLFGCGIGNYRFYEVAGFEKAFGYNAHNFYYFTLAETGIVGFIGLAILMVSLLRRCFVLWRSNVTFGRTICISFGTYLLLLYASDGLSNLFLLISSLIYASTRVKNGIIQAVDCTKGIQRQ